MTDPTLQHSDPQPKDPVDLLRAVRPLTDERRIEARTRARALVVTEAGDMPSPDQFENFSASKYPSWMTWLINISCLFVLVAAFLPSAFRLLWIGSHTFIATIPDAWAAMVTGFSIVIMAELSMVLFSIASVVIESHTHPVAAQPSNGWLAGLLDGVARIDAVKVMLLISQLVAAAIAIVGNAQVSLSADHSTGLFGYFEAFGPSVLVFMTAYILKAQMLHSIKRRYENAQAYQMALNAWKLATSQPEKSPRYKSALNNALRDFLREDNAKGMGATARREYMAGLLTADWIHLVKREHMAEDWYQDPSAVHPPSNLNGQMNGYPPVQPISVHPPSALNGRMNGQAIQSSVSVQAIRADEQRTDGADGQRGHGTGEGYAKNMEGKPLAELFFDRHSEYIHSKHKLDELVTILEEKMGKSVGRTTIGNVRKDLKERQGQIAQ